MEVSNFLYLNKSHIYTLLTCKFLIIVSNKHSITQDSNSTSLQNYQTSPIDKIYLYNHVS